jgi:hypothetical protein
VTVAEGDSAQIRVTRDGGALFSFPDRFVCSSGIVTECNCDIHDVVRVEALPFVCELIARLACAPSHHASHALLSILPP